MELLIAHPLLYIAIVFISFFISIGGIPSIIVVSLKYKIFDTTDSYRKIHDGQTSSLGGISIFCGFTITTLMFAATVNYQQANFLLTSCIILFAMGLKDDIYGVNPLTKFMMQIIVATILVVWGDFRLSSLYGVFNFWEVNLFWGSIFSVIVIIFVNNAFNLIDGVDGLSGTLGALATLSYGVFFTMADALPYAIIAFAMFGSIAGFLMYNYSPAKIFMGDTGALMIGLVSVILAIKFIEINKLESIPKTNFYSAPSIAVAVMLVPIFDSLRIFFIRIINGKSPFIGDRNHIHHRLQQLGFSSNKIVISLSIFTIAMIFMSVSLQTIGNFTLISLLLFICVFINTTITYMIGKKKYTNYKFYYTVTKDMFHRHKGLI